MCCTVKPGIRMLSVWSGMTSFSKENALELLHGEKWEELHLRLPKDWEGGILAMKEGFDFKSVLEEMSELGQVRIPEDAQMVRSWKPFLEGVWSLAGNREVHCFMDPLSFAQHRQISLDLASESIKARLGFLDIGSWRELLEEEAHLSMRDGKEEASRLTRSAGEGAACVDLPSESERRLVDEGFRITRISLGGAELPLSTLKGKMIRARVGGEEVPDESIEKGVREHLEFLELLLCSNSFDEACLAWSTERTNGS